MRKNTAGQVIGAQMVSAADGSAFTGAVTCYVCGDGGTQAAGSGACTHEGNGYHTYAPAQAETNYDLVAYTFVGTGAVPATVQVFTGYPQTGDSYARLGAPAGASVSADIAAIEAQTDDIGTAGAGLTAIGDARLANLDATVSSRSTYAGGDTAGTTELLTRIPDATPGTVGGLPLSKDASGRVEVSGTKNTLDSVITAIQGADGDTLKDLSDEIALVGGGGGAGTGAYTDTVTDGTNPLDGVIVELSTDTAKANVVYQTRTNASGVFLFHPDPGTYYVWFELAGHNFDAENGAEVVVV